MVVKTTRILTHFRRKETLNVGICIKGEKRVLQVTQISLHQTGDHMRVQRVTELLLHLTVELLDEIVDLPETATETKETEFVEIPVPQKLEAHVYANWNV